MYQVSYLDIIAADGLTGFVSEVRCSWPWTRVQRCVFHPFCQVRRYTTSCSQAPPGVALYGLAGDLLRIETLLQTDRWIERRLQRYAF